MRRYKSLRVDDHNEKSVFPAESIRPCVSNIVGPDHQKVQYQNTVLLIMQPYFNPYIITHDYRPISLLNDSASWVFALLCRIITVGRTGFVNQQENHFLCTIFMMQAEDAGEFNVEENH
ncbi:hypothetical protein J6590_040042 [Homalodisca vitripennis]|nr:hypothetical protein J6590_040042 [Homalodisca vitripennis]